MPFFETFCSPGRREGILIWDPNFYQRSKCCPVFVVLFVVQSVQWKICLVFCQIWHCVENVCSVTLTILFVLSVVTCFCYVCTYSGQFIRYTNSHVHEWVPASDMKSHCVSFSQKKRSSVTVIFEEQQKVDFP